tara:strand:- start:677 stop:862 length:186 start_codon:yes stop_codon:yes gene_type:complete
MRSGVPKNKDTNIFEDFEDFCDLWSSYIIKETTIIISYIHKNIKCPQSPQSPQKNKNKISK